MNAPFNVPGNSACDDKNLKADLKGGQKKSFCIYCHKIYSKLPRHLYDKHRSEEDVAKILSYPQGSDARKQEISSLRKKGNFLHNVTEEYNNGVIIPVRRPRTKRSGLPIILVHVRNVKDFIRLIIYVITSNHVQTEILVQEAY